MLKKTLTLAVATALFTGYGVSFAKGPGGNAGGSGSMGAAHSGTSVTSPASPVPATSSARTTNSNGFGTADRDLGLDRAAERRSAQGTANANDPMSANRATGRDRADDRAAMRSGTKVKPGKAVDHSRDRLDARTQTREERMAQALSNWERTHR